MIAGARANLNAWTHTLMTLTEASMPDHGRAVCADLVEPAKVHRTLLLIYENIS